jgi:DNA-binding transcriptional ArsR family regulator
MDWLNYHHVLYFWTVVREGGVSKAAEKLRLSQPTISAQVKILEEALGERLFQGKGRTLVLTDVGRVLNRLNVRRAGGVTHGPALPGDGAARDREERTAAAQPDGEG